MLWKSGLLLCVSAAALLAQYVPSSAQLFLDPEPRIRPLESAALQFRLYAQATKADGTTEVGRLLRSNPKVRIVTPNGGWVSKPFRFQGQDTDNFLQEKGSQFGSIFQSLTQKYVVQDAVLYTAPEQPGRYLIEAELEGQKASLEVEVTADAPSRKPAETVSFDAEPKHGDPYRPLAERYAPMLAQETWWQPKSDYITRFDFDGDWQGDNNWDNGETGTSQAYVYYAVMETETHWFLIYNAFHPRDYSDKCAMGSCHENDNEGLILTVRKDGSEFGRLEVMETLAHNNVYTFTNDRTLRNNIHNIDGGIDFYQETHPVAFIESGGHGILGGQARQSTYNFAGDTFRDNTGVTFVYKGVAERPRHANDRLVGYDLLPIYDHWWTKACQQESGWTERTFDEYFSYAPVAGRPGTACRVVGGTFYGRKESANKAKPFWGWHDNATQKKRALATGQWALDPAFAIQQSLRFPADKPVSTRYIFNPYLGVGGAGSWSQ
jgi:hypothetical protein